MHTLLLALFLFQAAPAPAPQLTTTEQIALSAVVQNFQKAIGEINEDVKKNHPGFQIDPNTLKLTPLKPQETAPAKEPVKK